MKRERIFNKYRIVPIQYLKSSGNLLGWLIARAAAQAVLTIVLARALGANSYGLYVGIIAVASFLSPFAGLGLSNIVLRNSSKDPKNIDFYFTKAFNILVLSSVFCVLLSWIIAKFLLPNSVPWIAVLAVIATEIVSSSLSELYARHMQAQNRVSFYGLVTIGLPLIRLICFGLLLLTINDLNVEYVLWTHAACGTLFTLIIWQFKPKHQDCLNPAEDMTIKAGLQFSLAMFSNRMQNEFNKPILSHISFGIAGNYNIAQRVNELASIPLVALQEALWPRLYSLNNPLARLISSGIFILFNACLISFIIWITAPFIPKLLGEGFNETANIMRYLAFLPIFQVLRSLINFQVINRNKMSLLGWTYIFGALTSIVLVYAMIPAYGLIGAVIAAYTAEAVMLVILLTGLYARSKNG